MVSPQTGTKFFVLCDAGDKGAEGLLHGIHQLFGDFVMKEPFYVPEMPIRCAPGAYPSLSCFSSLPHVRSCSPTHDRSGCWLPRRVEAFDENVVATVKAFNSAA